MLTGLPLLLESLVDVVVTAVTRVTHILVTDVASQRAVVAARLLVAVPSVRETQAPP